MCRSCFLRESSEHNDCTVCHRAWDLSIAEQPNEVQPQERENARQVQAILERNQDRMARQSQLIIGLTSNQRRMLREARAENTATLERQQRDHARELREVRTQHEQELAALRVQVLPQQRQNANGIVTDTRTKTQLKYMHNGNCPFCNHPFPQFCLNGSLDTRVSCTNCHRRPV